MTTGQIIIIILILLSGIPVTVHNYYAYKKAKRQLEETKKQIMKDRMRLEKELSEIRSYLLMKK